MKFNFYRMFYDFDMDYSMFESTNTTEVNQKITQIMNNFIAQYNKYFEDYTFILEYEDNIAGILSYIILKNLRSIYSFNLKIVSDKIKETKKYIIKKDKISLKKANKINKTIWFNCFNPLFYVENDKQIFNKLSKDNSLISKFTPITLKILAEFYNIEEKFINQIYGGKSLNFEDFTERKVPKDPSQIIDIYRTMYYNFNIPKIKLYSLQGNENDFKIFDEIRNSTDTINFYTCPEDKEDWVMTNLNPFVEKRNCAVKGFNLNINREDYMKLLSERQELINSFREEKQ